MTDLSIGDRRILLKAMVVRRIPEHTRIESMLLMEALQADYEKVRTETPQYYFNDWSTWLARELEDCVEQELVDDGTSKKRLCGSPKLSYTRTNLGNIFLRTLEPKLAEAIDVMPMSDVGVLDFLSLL